MRKFPILLIAVALVLSVHGYCGAQASESGEEQECFQIEIVKERLFAAPDKKIRGRYDLYWEAFINVSRDMSGACTKAPVTLSGDCSLYPLGRWQMGPWARITDKVLRPGINSYREKLKLATIDLTREEAAREGGPRFGPLFDKDQTVKVELSVRLLASGGATGVLSRLERSIEPLTYWLVASAEDGSYDEIKRALEKGADVNAATWTGVTALMAASANGYADIVKLLLSKGAEVNLKTKGTPLAESSLGNRMPGGGTALMAAALRGDVQIVRMLLDKGAEVNARRRDYWTALHAAAFAGDPQVVSLLIAKKARVDAADQTGYSPLALAIINGNGAATRILKQHSAPLKVPWDELSE
jgi:hypothetical protein